MLSARLVPLPPACFKAPVGFVSRPAGLFDLLSELTLLKSEHLELLMLTMALRGVDVHELVPLDELPLLFRGCGLRRRGCPRQLHAQPERVRACAPTAGQRELLHHLCPRQAAGREPKGNGLRDQSSWRCVVVRCSTDGGLQVNVDAVLRSWSVRDDVVKLVSEP